MSRKHRNQETERRIIGLSQLQKTFNLEHPLFCHHNCQCILCRKPIEQKIQKQRLAHTRDSAIWMHQILNLLTNKNTKTLKFFIAPICFPTQDGVQIFNSDKKQFRVLKLPNIPNKMLFSTMVRLKQQYKSMLQSSYMNKMIDQMNPQYMHKKYFNRLLPKFFHDGDSCNVLESNKAHFKNYILHKNDKYTIATIEQHKMNQREPFCAIKYKDNNFTQVSQKDFEIQNVVGNFCDNLQTQISYIQIIIKSKLQSESFLYSEYDQGDQKLTQIGQNSLGTQPNKKLFQKAQTYVLSLLGAISKYDDKYIDLQSIEDINDELMLISSYDYINFMTFSIIHYLAMVANVYVKRIKLKWVVNDIGQHYLQEVLDYQTSNKCSRLIIFRLLMAKDNESFYRDSRYFIKVRKQIQNDSKSKNAYDSKAKLSQMFSRISSTIQYAQDKISQPQIIQDAPLFILPQIPINQKKILRINKKTLALAQRSRTLQLRDIKHDQTIDLGSLKKTRYEIVYQSLRPKKSVLFNPEKSPHSKDFKNFMKKSTKNTTINSIQF